MGIGKISLKNIVTVILLFVGGMYLYNKYNKYRVEVVNGKILEESRKDIDKKIAETEEQKKNEKIRMQDKYAQITVLTEKISLLSIKDESEFKKMVYILAKESNLKLKEISKSETLWERNGYRLKYIHFNLYGSLNDFGKFMFFVNKSKKYIDTSKMYIRLTNEGFRISLGFIEKVKINVK